MENNNTYQSLADIRQRKEELRNEITKDDQKIRTYWEMLFHKEEIPSSSSAPARRLASFMNIGIGVLDGVILGWKLYRKFKR